MIPTPRNTVVAKPDYHISYLPYQADYGDQTTAIVLRDNAYLILNGNHLEKLQALPDAGACFDYFLEHIEQASWLSEHRAAAFGSESIPSLQKTAIEVLGQDRIDKLREALQ